MPTMYSSEWAVVISPLSWCDAYILYRLNEWFLK